MTAIAQRSWERPHAGERLTWDQARQVVRTATGMHTAALCPNQVIDDAIDQAVSSAYPKAHLRQLWQVTLTEYTDEVELPWAPTNVLLCSMRDMTSDAGLETPLGYGQYDTHSNRWRWLMGSDGWFWQGDVQLLLWVVGPPQPRDIETTYCTLTRQYLHRLAYAEMWPWIARMDGTPQSEIMEKHPRIREEAQLRLPRMLIPPHIPQRKGKSSSETTWESWGQTDVTFADLA